MLAWYKQTYIHLNIIIIKQPFKVVLPSNKTEFVFCSENPLLHLKA